MYHTEMGAIHCSMSGHQFDTFKTIIIFAKFLEIAPFHTHITTMHMHVHVHMYSTNSRYS